MPITAIIGGQWGDEGKGKIVDLLSRDANMVARFQGGANAGHTVYKGDQKIVLHQIPSGILTENCQCVLGNGMVIDPVDLVEELDMLTGNGVHYNGSIHIAANAHIVTPVHKWIDSRSEENSGQRIGTTCRGIGPAMSPNSLLEMKGRRYTLITGGGYPCPSTASPRQTRSISWSDFVIWPSIIVTPKNR